MNHLPRRMALPYHSGKFLLMALLFPLTGCDSGPPMGQVSGVITNGSSPVSAGTVIFFPTVGGPMAQGQLDREGRYTLTTKTSNDGAIVGDYLVAVVPPTDAGLLMSELKPGQMRRKTTYDNIPKHVRNHNTSGLSTSVKQGPNKIDFDLSQTTAP